MKPYVPEKRGWGHYFKMCVLYVTLIVGAFVLYFVATYLVGLYQMKAMQDEAATTAISSQAAHK